MKKLIFLLPIILASTSNSFATVCAGELESGNFVSVELSIWGSIGRLSKAKVNVYNKYGVYLYDYEIDKEEFVQFGEEFSPEESKIGTLVFKAGTASKIVSISYRGTDYTNESKESSLLAILKDKKRQKQPGNHMIVWRGSTYDYEDFFKFTDVVCRFGDGDI